LNPPINRITPEMDKIKINKKWLLGTPKINNEFKGSNVIPKKFKKLTC